MLHLDHSLAIAGVIRLAEALGHHTVEAQAGVFAEPIARNFSIARRRRKVEQRLPGHRGEKLFELCAPLLDWLIDQAFSLEHEKIECEVLRGRLAGQLANARLGRMNSLQKMIK